MEYKELKTYKLIDKEGYFKSHSRNKALYAYYSVSDCLTGYIDSDGDLVDIKNYDTLISENSYGEFKFFEEVVSESEVLESAEEFITRCVKENNGKWPLSDYDRHVHWDKDLGWNNQEGKSVYYVDFDKKVAELARQTDTPEEKYWDGVSELEVGMIVGLLNSERQYKVLLLKTDDVMRTFAVIEDQYSSIHVKPITSLKSILPNPKELFCKEVLEEIRSKSIDFAHDTTWDIKEVAAICWNKLGGGADE